CRPHLSLVLLSTALSSTDIYTLSLHDALPIFNYGGFKMNSLLDFSEKLIDISILISIVGISLSLLLLLYRVMQGPTNPDRAVGLDLIGINLMGLAALTAMILLTNKLNDVILLIGILSFLGTVGISKYLEKGVLIERDMD